LNKEFIGTDITNQTATMDSFMLQDEGVRDRIRQAEEFLDPSMYTAHSFLSLKLVTIPLRCIAD